jgi:hypothetical protein
VGVDAARGVALLGMIAMHSLYVSNDAGRPTWPSMIFSGRAAAVFAVLVGTGIAFTTGRRRVHLSDGLPTAAALGARALAIGAIGLALGYADAELREVVLPYYAVMVALAIPLVFLPTWLVALLGVAVAAGMPALSHVLRSDLPEPTLENATFGHVLDQPVALLTKLSLTGFYPALPWMAYLCAGLVIGRLNLVRTRVVVLLLATGAALAVAASAASSILLNRYGGLARIWAAQPDSGLTEAETIELLALGGEGTTPTSTWWWLTTDAPHTGTPFHLAGTIGAALALLGTMLLASRLTRPVPRRLAALVQVPLAGAGAMTLTFYVGHIIFINSEWDNFDAVTGYLLQVAVVLAVGLACRATVGRGPLEGLVTALASRARRLATPASQRALDRRTTDTTSTQKAMRVDDDDRNAQSASGPGVRA